MKKVFEAVRKAEDCVKGKKLKVKIIVNAEGYSNEEKEKIAQLFGDEFDREFSEAGCETAIDDLDEILRTKDN